MFEKIKQKAGEYAKAIVALAIPIAIGAAVELVDALSQWASETGSVWSGIAVGVLTAAGVWLKANRPPA